MPCACTASRPNVAASGVSMPIFGTNPIAVAIPSAEGPPLVLDAHPPASSSATWLGHRDAGTPPLAGVALDLEVNPPLTPAQRMHSRHAAP
ncbi:Ldh family oxidoreductase [Nostocoides japonicum]|uniref:Ldh family oxidoreductase n=1 Tax=Nostocoides japonicum TaxID=99481 RepID=UPI0009FB3031